ncbi:hypothetical protein G9C85_06080 [Halorubellus sp. JP-L1]|uniref:hypothetical protein n=1 Tax=Halorubellus sp. JP-L1 TaxID=2715753 RepID=UPI00140E198A|nr:hypothetical protein [Halorubellus sp. JP-L1]NHN41205.1 hypothetical protein [Halorubellus sp. JP-L1]
MNARVRCPVCGTETPRRRFPRHVAETHPGDQLRDTFGYSAGWAGVLPALALALLAAQVAVVVLGLPRTGVLRDAIATWAGIAPGSVSTYLALVVAPAVAVAVGVAVVALARGPGQRVRRGWRPRRYEHVLVLTWAVPWVGPTLYVLGAGRRFVSVRFLREKLAGGGIAASDDLAEADAALAAHREQDAAVAFETAGRLVQALRDDPHFRNPTLGARLDALGRACGMATAITAARAGEHRQDEHRASDRTPTPA